MQSVEDLPRNLGSYELVELVGSGGMGTVYRAIDRRSGTTVAVKIIHEHLRRDPAFLERFRDEAHLASLITSPYIARVLEFGSDQGQYFLAAEFIEGTRLATLIESKHLTMDQSVAIASQVAMALQAATAHRVVHRDVKPDNIIVTPDSFVKLMDFGIAPLSYVETRQLFLGTVAYAAPEQFRGETTSRSDIYSLGVVLFQMLAGELPFKGDTLSSLIRMHEETLPPLDKLPRVPQALQDVVTKCLEKDPDKRYQTPSELLEALRQVRRTLTTSEDSTWMAQTMTGLVSTAIASDAPPVASVATPVAVPVREAYRRPPSTATGDAWRRPLPLLLAGAVGLAVIAIVAAIALGLGREKKADVLAPAPTQAGGAVAAKTTFTPVPATIEAPAAVPTIPPTPLPLRTATQAPPIFVPPTAVSAPAVAPPLIANLSAPGRHKRGAFFSRFTNTTRPEFNGQTFWQVQGSPTPLSAGTYRFELSVDGSVVSTGSFTLTC